MASSSERQKENKLETKTPHNTPVQDPLPSPTSRKDVGTLMKFLEKEHLAPRRDTSQSPHKEPEYEMSKSFEEFSLSSLGR